MKLLWLAVCVGLLAVVVYADYVTTYELTLNVFYLGPILISTWYIGWRTGACFVLLCAALWMWVDYRTGHPYAHVFYRFWSGAILFAGYAIVAGLMAQLRRMLDRATALAAEKEAALRELRKSTAKLRQLEGTFQTICSWTGMIKDGDQWIPIEEYLKRHLNIEITHGISPAAKRKLTDSLAPFPAKEETGQTTTG